MIINTRKKLIELWCDDGITCVEESIWSSKLQQGDLMRIREFLSKNNFQYADISIVRPQDDKTERMKFRTHYNESGQCISTNYGISIPKNSNNLKLIIGLKSGLKNQECQDQTLYIINSLRIVFGVTIARKLMFTTSTTMDKFIEADFSSELGFASNFDTQNLNLYDGIEQSELRKLPVDALILLDKAFQQKFPNERFILMWVAFEAIINSMYVSDHNGNKRIKYFKEELGSTVANDEVYRLFKIRCDVFKEGKFQHTQFDEENWSLYAAIQLAIMEKCPQRDAFLKGYEQYIFARS